MDGIFENARSRGLDEYSFLFRDRQRPNYHRRDQNRHRESFNYHNINNNNNNNSSPSILQGVKSRTEVLLSLHLKIIHVSVWHCQGGLNEKGNSFRGERIVFWWPNTNTNTLRPLKNDPIQIWIVSACLKVTEYEWYFKKWPNTNMNTMLWNNIKIRIRMIIFGLNYSNTI